MGQERNKRKTNMWIVGLNAYDDEECFSPCALMGWRVSRQAVIQIAAQMRKEKEHQYNLITNRMSIRESKRWIQL